MVDMEKMERLTLVMPTYNRQPYALRNMQYWSGKGVTVRVLDGSDHPISSSLLSGLGSNIIYKHEQYSFVQRLNKVLPEIDTEYVALIGDDEFYIPSAVEACISELDLEPSLVACCGRALGFYTRDGIVYGRKKYPKLERYSLLQDDPSERVSSHMRDYVPTLIYAIVRVSQWKRAIYSYTEKEFPVFAIGELQVEMCLSFSGKSKVLPHLMWLRCSNDSPKIQCTDVSLSPETVFPKWWSSSKNSEDREIFIQILSRAFEDLNTEYQGDYRLAVSDACMAYLQFYAERQDSRKVRGLAYLIRSISYRFPSFLKIFIKSILFKLFKKFPPAYSFIDMASELENTGVRVDFEALVKIEKIILGKCRNLR